MEQRSIDAARKTLGDLVDAARWKGETTIITRQGKPAAMIAPLPAAAITIDALAAELAETYDLTHAAARDEVVALVAQLADDSALYDERTETLTTAGADLIRSQMATTHGVTVEHMRQLWNAEYEAVLVYDEGEFSILPRTASAVHHALVLTEAGDLAVRMDYEWNTEAAEQFATKLTREFFS